MKKIFLTILAVLMVAPVFGQGKYGADSAECIKYLSYYTEYMKQKNYAEATPSWQKAIRLCPPTASQKLLTDGQTLVRRMINGTKDKARRTELIDSLIMLHDVRIEYYPKYAQTAANNKALDMINLYGDRKEELYNGLSEIVGTLKEKVNPVALVNRMKVAGELYAAGKLTADQVMETYTENAEYFETIISCTTDEQAPAMKRDMETFFANSGVANCDNLLSLYTPRYQANPSDIALAKSIVKIMGSAQCVDNEIFLGAVENVHKSEPSATTAYYLYRLHSARDNHSEAIAYMREAIATEGLSAADKAEYLLELGTFCFKKADRKAEAVSAALEAAEVNPALAGRAYLLIGTIWGSVRCGGDEISSRAQYWVAVDYLTKAKNADETLAEDANRMIGQYRSYFPAKSDAFMYDLLDGQSYTASCGGLHATTTVRTN